MNESEKQTKNYEEYDIDFLEYDKDVVRILTTDFIRINKAIVLNKKEDVYICAISNIYDITTIDKLEAILDGKIKLIHTQNEKIQKLNSLVNNEIKEITFKKEKEDKTVYKNEINNAPVVRIFESILREGTARNASDIHIEPFEKHFRIRFRIDGVLNTFIEMAIDIYEALVARIKVLANLNITERRKPQDGRIRNKINDIEYDFRISIIPTVYGEKIVIRILDSKSFAFSIGEIGFTLEKQKEIEKIIGRRSGIILVTGPTGCGKSTTLYTFLEKIKTDGINVVTVEDPVEYTFSGITQIQVNEKIGFTFSEILKSILRQDPDVIMIGEIRDEETASLAIRLAITGHLVLSTLHTNDSIGAITRLINLNVEPFMVSSSLNAVISQRLVRKLCNECKKPHQTTKEEMKILELNEETTIYTKCGCSICHNTGYIGRTGVYEILKINEEIKDILVKNYDYSKIKTKALKTNELGLEIDARRLVLEGVTSLEEYLKVYEKK